MQVGMWQSRGVVFRLALVPTNCECGVQVCVWGRETCACQSAFYNRTPTYVYVCLLEDTCTVPIHVVFTDGLCTFVDLIGEL